MARSHVLVPSAGTIKLATYQYTDGANVKDDEISVNGEQFLASYTVVAAVSTATANSHLLQIMAGAALKVRIRRIEIGADTLATAVALMDTRIYRLTTAGTGGGVATPLALDNGLDGAAGATGMTLPTVKGTEGALIALGRAYMVQTLAASTPVPYPLLAWDFDRPRSKPLIIAAGAANGIAIKNVTAVAAGGVTILVWLDESPY